MPIVSGIDKDGYQATRRFFSTSNGLSFSQACIDFAIFRHDGAGVLRAAGIRTFSVTSIRGTRQALADAISAAMAGTAVSLHLPTNVQLAEMERPTDALEVRAPHFAPAPAKPQSIAAATAFSPARAGH